MRSYTPSIVFIIEGCLERGSAEPLQTVYVNRNELNNKSFCFSLTLNATLIYIAYIWQLHNRQVQSCVYLMILVGISGFLNSMYLS